MSLKLIQLNIEGDNHYERIFPFIQKEQPDVVCLQEFFIADLSLFEEKLGMKGVVVPTLKIQDENPFRMTMRGEQGVAIFSKLQIQSHTVHMYVGEEKVVPVFDITDPNSGNRALLVVRVEKDGKPYTIATTHFTWTQSGSVSEEQQENLQTLLEILKEYDEVILSGDFNAPRGREIFNTLATVYTDNVPKDAKTTIDQNLHRVSGIQFVVDGLFTSSGYKVTQSKVVDGVSDHCAIVGEIV